MSSSAAAPATQPALAVRSARLFISPEKRRVLICLVLVLLTLAFYNPVVHNGFTNFDDDLYITNNPHVKAGLTWETVKWAFTTIDVANWHPLTWLSHALDYQLFKLNPAGHHYVGLLLHAGNASLLFLLLESVTGFTGGSFIVAALFALHPMNVESVAWASERKNVLSMTCFLLTLHAYGWYAQRENIKRYAAVASLFALGLMAKPEIITLPFVLLLWDYWPLRRMVGHMPPKSRSAPFVARPLSFLCLEKLPLLLLSAGNAWITLKAQKAAHTLRDAPAWERWGNAAVAYVRYLGKAFWPVRLAALYPHPGRLLPIWEIVVASLALGLLTALVLYSRRRYMLVGWLWFLGTLVPVIGVVHFSLQAMADRYAYLSYIGLFICLVWGTAEVAQRWSIPVPWLGVAAVCMLFALGMVSRRQVSYWHDGETLWRHALSVTQRNFVAHNAFGSALADDGKVEEAIVQFRAAESLNAYTAAEIVHLGVYEQSQGHVREAIEEYEQALKASPDHDTLVSALSLLGSAFTQTNDIPRAKISYGLALRENPDESEALVGSGLLAEREGNADTAVEQISRAMKVEPTDVGYLLLERALRRTGRPQEADAAHAQAQRISHDFSRAQRLATEVLASAGVSTD